ncbi:MAG: hypothetical protein IJO32_03515 [Bacilli bacterium]|nr:hypothetical protein [Bacilli bacterium]
MEIKEIALKLCNLPEGEYLNKSKLGNIKIINTKPNERNDFKTVKIFINDELYDEIIYSTFDYTHLWEKIHLKNNDQKYILKREILENKNTIEYIDENDEKFEIHGNCIYNYNNSTLAGPSYYIVDGLLVKKVTDSSNIKFTYNLENDEKKLYIRKNNIGNSVTKENSVTVSGDIYRFITKYNKLINIINKNTISCSKNQEELNEFTNNRFEELIESNLIPIIDEKKVKILDEELNKYKEIYKEYSPKLNETHSKEMLEILSMISTTLDDVFKFKMNNKTNNNKKIFNLSRFKNK